MIEGSANSNFLHVDSDKMGYEDSVYLAKLAEQAERYEGGPHPSRHLGRSIANIVIQKWWRT